MLNNHNMNDVSAFSSRHMEKDQNHKNPKIQNFKISKNQKSKISKFQKIKIYTYGT